LRVARGRSQEELAEATVAQFIADKFAWNIVEVGEPHSGEFRDSNSRAN
jgi:hypothetical protein